MNTHEEDMECSWCGEYDRCYICIKSYDVYPEHLPVCEICFCDAEQLPKHVFEFLTKGIQCDVNGNPIPKCDYYDMPVSG